MGIVTLDKLTVYGTRGQQQTVLDGLQRLGCLHLIRLNDHDVREPEVVAEREREALRYLEACPQQRSPSASESHYDRDRVTAETLEIMNRSASLTVERDNVQKAIADLRPWGDFVLPAPEQIGGLQLWFYILPTSRLNEIPADTVFQTVSTVGTTAYVVVLADEPPDMPFQPVELDRRPLSQLEERLAAIREELDELYWKRVSLTRFSALLLTDLNIADDEAAQRAAAEGLFSDDYVFALQGWMPRSAANDVRRFAEDHRLAVTIVPVHEEDVPPTLLKNPERIAGAEGCVTFYITPAYRAWDPTLVVYFSFSLFFAMIVADAGYGLMMAGLLLVVSKRLSRSESGRRFRHLLTGIVIATILYGVLLGSYFGVEPPAGSLGDRVRVSVDGGSLMEQQTLMMVIAVAIGVAHLVLANVISAWRRRFSLRCLGYLGWGNLILGAFLLGIGRLWHLPFCESAATVLIAVGGLSVLFFSSEQPLMTWRPMAHCRRLLDGVLQFANVSKAFGDSLSYLRLFALGLASAQLAVTFNDLAADTARVGGPGVLLALLILVVGHGINFLLGLMGGVVHGLRLNCIEFFNWSLTEEGYPFRPFKKKALN